MSHLGAGLAHQSGLKLQQEAGSDQYELVSQKSVKKSSVFVQKLIRHLTWLDEMLLVQFSYFIYWFGLHREHSNTFRVKTFSKNLLSVHL